MDRIVVGFDGSTAAAAALAWAVREAELHGATLAVWTVVDDLAGPPPAAAEAMPGDEVPRPIEALADQILGDTPAERRTGYGSAAAELVRSCTGADLLVVGSRGRNPVAGLLLGSVSRACLHTAPCPVVVLRPEPTDAGAEAAPPYGRVVVGIDGSAPARRALIVAAEEARLRGAALHAAHGVRWDHLGGELLAPATRELVAWGRELVATELAETDIAARCVVVPGHAADVLVGQSAQADLLVVGHRGHRRPPGLLLGSIADHCARHAHCPVMIVRAEHPGP